MSEVPRAEAPPTVHRVEVVYRDEIPDPRGRAAATLLTEAGLRGLECVRTARLYVLEGASDPDRIARELLVDPVVERHAVDAPCLPEKGPQTRVLTVVRRPGVMDPASASVRRGVHDLGERVEAVRTAWRYYLMGELDDAAERLAIRVLANATVEEVLVGPARVPGSLGQRLPPGRSAARVSLNDLEEDALLGLARGRGLSLDLEEMRAVQQHFLRLGREPTDVELETIAQTWSEHCKHKTFAAPIRYTGPEGRREVVDGIFRTFIVAATRAIAAPWCVSVFEDNAGVVAFDGPWCLSFKVETHNHPSALEPYGGAGTGLGGVIRDTLGTGLGARPIASTDVFCLGPPDLPALEVPPGVLHPRRVLRGVVAGVRDYGNRMGIPTVNGALVFDRRYAANPLVYCGSVGLVPRDRVAKEARSGDLVVAVGGRTGRDGIHGATFSSAALDESSETLSSGAVQIGDPITEKRLADAVLAARDRGLHRSITDCGAGGFSSAVGEMARGLGAEVDLDQAPLKYPGLGPAEVWISEAQERMVLAVPPAALEGLRALCAEEDVEVAVLGRFTDSGRLVLSWHGETVGDLDLAFLHEGMPRPERVARWDAPRRASTGTGEGRTPRPRRPSGEVLLALLSGWDTCSREWVVRQYDHEVQGAAAVRPLVGPWEGPSDAAVLAPLAGSRRGVAIACGLAPRYGDLDPYRMAACSIDEAVRNAVAVGADPARIAILDNFAWGDPSDPATLGALVRAAQACHDVAVGLGTPFISGKDSLNNVYRHEGRATAIPGTLLVSALGVLEDVTRSITMDLKGPGHRLHAVGLTRDEVGGSAWGALEGLEGGEAPAVDAGRARAIYAAVHQAMGQGLVLACHDASEGGLGVALAEMALAGEAGLEVDLGRLPVDGDLDDARRLWSESASRLLLEAAPEAAGALEACLAGLPHADIGATTASGRLVVRGTSGGEVLEAPLEALREAWRTPLGRALEGGSP
ncbi:MAG: phosphoribosylformylglycinamidine synthase subunit PurL [Planctomycetes bacterium]|nr:phosphoribosylformylglycinamidine synthase subunit PurL [Planctomycetota bacterium]